MNINLEIIELAKEITRELREKRKLQENLKMLEIYSRKFKYTDSSFFVSGWNVESLKNIINLQLNIIKCQNNQIQTLQESVDKLQI